MPPRPEGRGARFMWGLDFIARVGSGQRVFLAEDVEAARESVRVREAARREAEDASASVPVRVTPGSVYEVGAAVDAALHWFGLPPTSGRDVAGTCAMQWREIGRKDGPTRACASGADYVADLGVRGGARLPVCSAHAHQLVHAHRARPDLSMPTMHPLRSGVTFGLPPEYLGGCRA